MNATFAVVGHPNKGKSSIVATLSHDASVTVSAIPGTTNRCHDYPMRVDGELLYTLVDTPGFQRARGALAWLEAHETSAAQRPAAVKAFIDEFRGTGQFTDEVELLTPVVNGAGIIYVTDGSRPYGREYEAEMEILRWTGRPSMALINPIGGEQYVGEWRTALGQYFRIVRVFSAWEAEFAKHVDILRAFAQLDDDWRPQLERAASVLQLQRQQRREQAAKVIAATLVDMLCWHESTEVPAEEDPEPYKSPLQHRLLTALRKRETDGRKAVEEIYHYRDLERDESPLGIASDDLFAQQAWEIFGLTRLQLAATGAVSGALAGAGVDLVLHGTSMMTGAAVGTIVGGLSAWLGFDKLAETKVRGLPMGGMRISVGPIKSLNFPFVVLGRALFHHQLIARRTHAQRDRLTLDAERMAVGTRNLPDTTRRELARIFARLRRVGLADAADETGMLAAVLLPLLDNDGAPAQPVTPS